MPIDSVLNSALENQIYFYQIYGHGIQKSSQTLKSGLKTRKTTFVIYSRKTGKSWDQTFLTGTCQGIVVTWAGLDFDSGSLTCDHGLIFPKKRSKSAKSNPIFHWKGTRDTALIFRFFSDFFRSFSKIRSYLVELGHKKPQKWPNPWMLHHHETFLKFIT